jgi:hypothetical protein
VVDVFEEVEEQLRAERYTSMTKRVLPWVIGALALALAVALSIWGYGEWRRRESVRASETYAQALEAAGNNPARAETLFRQVTETRSPAYRALALMQLAAIRTTQNKPREAVPLLDEAADAAPDEMIGDAARLKAAFLLMDYAPYTAIEERLRPLTEADRPYRLVAREALAMAKLQAGRAADARGDFLVIAQSLEASEQMRARAQAMAASIQSGAAAHIPAILKATPAPAAAPATPAPAQGAPAPTSTPR